MLMSDINIYVIMAIMKRSFSKGSYVHVIKRGVRGLPIVKDTHDKWRFMRLLRYFNDENSHTNWHRQVVAAGAEGRYMPWPKRWQERSALVHIHAFVLMPNHFHLLLEEIDDGGIAKFMKKISESMTKYYNKKYDQKGSLFQGPYKASEVTTDEYLKFLFGYILVKNPFELYPDGFKAAANNFESAFLWAKNYPFSNLPGFLTKKNRTEITEKSAGEEFFSDLSDFKVVAKEAVRYSQAKKLENIILE
jgi:putative transposase